MDKAFSSIHYIHIIKSGDDKHMAVRDLPNLHFDFGPQENMAESYVGLSTPPRVLTMEERFPHIEDPEDRYYASEDNTPKRRPQPVQNGYVTPVRRTSYVTLLHALTLIVYSIIIFTVRV
jgi:hypothetical protein